MQRLDGVKIERMGVCTDNTAVFCVYIRLYICSLFSPDTGV